MVTLELLPQMILLSGSLVLPSASTQHILHSPVLGTCFVCRLLFCLGEIMCIRGQLCLSKECCSLIHKSYVKSIKRYCFVRKCAAIPVQLEIFILQYFGWCILIIWTFVVNQFNCFRQFLMDNFGQYIMSLYTLGRCQLLTRCSNVLLLLLLLLLLGKERWKSNNMHVHQQMCK